MPNTDTATVTALIEELHSASVAYYQDLAESPLSDEDFDSKLAYLKTLEEAGSTPDLFAAGTKGFLLLEGDPSLGTKVTADEVVRHAVPMLSLGKAQTREHLVAFLAKARAGGAKGFRLQGKIDGFALSASYEDGELKLLATRGDGKVGENISFLINHDEVSIKGLPAKLDNHHDLEVRGEIFLTSDQFAAADAARTEAYNRRADEAVAAGRKRPKDLEAYKLSRNALVGIVKKAKDGLGFPAELTFAAYSVLEDRKPADMDALGSSDFNSVDDLTAVMLEDAKALSPEVPSDARVTDVFTDDEVFEAVRAFGIARKHFTLPTDGVVIKPTNEAAMLEAMGSSSHHPRSQVAYKYPSPTAVTEVLAIDLTVGKTGKITPVARVRTVLLDGSDISNLSLHNLNLVYTQDIRVGQTVEIHKANDIIPQVKTVLSTPEGAELIPVPTNCPVCDSVLEAAREAAGVWPPNTLLCKNADCESRSFYALKTAVGRDYLDIDGMSEKLLTNLNEIGRVTNFADLYTLTFDELKDANFGTTKEGNPVKLGEKRAQHILDHIEKSKEADMPKMVAALAIPGLGRSMTKILMKKFPTIQDLREATAAELAELDKVGEVRALAIVEGLKDRSDLIERLLEAGVKFTPAEVADSAHLAGKSFAISGAVPEPFANRNAWVDYIEKNGGEFHSGPKATTSFMVGDEAESSSKVVKAKKLGLQFLTPEAFTAEYVK